MLDGVARWLVDRPDGGGNALAVRIGGRQCPVAMSN
jgi:hypothetical protein